MANTLATIQISARNAFTVVLTWIRLTAFHLIISRRQFVLVVEI